MKKVITISAMMLLIIFEQSAQATLVLDQYQLNQNTTTSIALIDPSQDDLIAYLFTAGITGTLKQIDIFCLDNQSGSFIIDVHEGILVQTQTLLDQSDIANLQGGWVSFYVDAAVTAGQTYTLSVGKNSPVQSLETYGYTGDDTVGSIGIFHLGLLLFSTNTDIVFKTWVEPVPEPALIMVEIDIKPGSCPNPLNVKSKGVLPVAILGSADFDVHDIDVATIQLAGVYPNRSDYENVARPLLDADVCECSTEEPDGYMDLTLKFNTQEIVGAIGPVADDDELVLELTGLLHDGTPITGADCIIIRAKGQK